MLNIDTHSKHNPFTLYSRANSMTPSSVLCSSSVRKFAKGGGGGGGGSEIEIAVSEGGIHVSVYMLVNVRNT